MALDRKYAVQDQAPDLRGPQPGDSPPRMKREAIPLESSTADVLLGVWLGALVAFKLFSFPSLFWTTLFINMMVIVLPAVFYIMFRNTYLFAKSSWWAVYFVLIKLLIIFLLTAHWLARDTSAPSADSDHAYYIVLIISGILPPWLVIMQDQVVKRIKI